MTRLPVSLQSLIIQCVALPLAGLLAPALQALLSFQSGLWQLVFMQGGIAALFSLVWRQPAWWPPLHFGFFPAILLSRQLDVPAWVFLVAFLLLLLFYWSSFRTRVPLYLSDRKAWQAVTPLLPETKPFKFIDLGSGLGGLLFYLESRFPHGRFYGAEIAPAPWLISRARAGFKRSRVTFMRRDYGTLNLADFDVVFAFLSPAAMPDLWQQARSQMRSGSLFVSLSFAVDARPPDQVMALAKGDRHTLYVWRI